MDRGGGGAGGYCFIKDMAAYSRHYAKEVAHPEGAAFLKAAEKKNISLLVRSRKDLDLLKAVYGGGVLKKTSKRAKK